MPPQCRAPPFWAKNLGHNDIELHQPRQFIKELRNFLTLASKSPRLQRSTRFSGSISPRSSGEFEVAPMTYYKERGPASRTRPGVGGRPSSQYGVESTSRERPVRFDERGPSPARERQGSSDPPGILRNGDGQAIYARDIMRQGRDERLSPSPPPTKKLLNVKVERGSGRTGPVLGHGDVRRPRGPRDSHLVASTTRSNSISPTKQRRTKEEKSKSAFERQQQILQARAVSWHADDNTCG